MDFPTWFGAGCYGGLACCMFATAVNALYTTLSRRGTTRQLAGAIVTCVVCALLLLVALEWYNQRVAPRFIMGEDTVVSATEVGIVLVYVVLWGWLLPLSTTAAYCLLTQPRVSHDSMWLASLRGPAGKAVGEGRGGDTLSHHASTDVALRPFARTEENNVAGVLSPVSSYAPVTPIPIGRDNPWGWLEYCDGRFRGQQLKLVQMVVKLGRGEDVDILLEDERAERLHAELVCSRGSVSITNREGIVLLNGRAINGPTVLKQGDVFEVGSQVFRFVYAEPTQTLAEAGDPLQHHRWRTPITPLPPLNQNAAANVGAGFAAARLLSGRPEKQGAYSPLHLQDDGEKRYTSAPHGSSPPIYRGESRESFNRPRGSPVPLRLPSKQTPKDASRGQG